MIKNPHDAVTSAINKGILIKPLTCFKCYFETTKLEAHHNDYNNPLEVEWLCKKCHVYFHKNFKAIGTYNDDEERIEIRLEKELKKEFKDWCKKTVTTPSDELRRYIAKIVKEDKK